MGIYRVDWKECDGCMLVVLWEGDAILPVTMLEGHRMRDVMWEKGE
jgi:hypothetical protein